MSRLAFAALPISLLLAGCGSGNGGKTAGDIFDESDENWEQGDDSGTSSDGGTDTGAAVDDEDEDGSDEDCDVEVVYGSSPSHEAVDFFYRDAIEFEIDGADPGAHIELNTSAGTEVAGATELSEGGLVVSFRPYSPLAPNNYYTATLETCMGSVSIDFGTSELGADLEGGASSLEGRTYAIDLSSGRFVKPAGVGSLIASSIESDLLAGVVSANSSSLEMMGASSESGRAEQDYCEPTLHFPEDADFSEAPYFKYGPADSFLNFGGLDLKIYQLEVTGAFGPDGTYIGGMKFSGELDAEALADVLAAEGLISSADPEAVCDLLAAFGVVCEPCPSGDGDYCLPTFVDQLTGEEIDRLVLEEVDECDPERCDGGCDR